MNKLSETPGKPGVVQDLECLKPSNSGCVPESYLRIQYGPDFMTPLPPAERRFRVHRIDF